jgi:hypothetical protein
MMQVAAKIKLVLAAALVVPFSPAIAQLEDFGQVPETNVTREYTLSDAVPDENGIHRMAILRALDKVTGRAINLNAPAGVPVDFGTLTITARYCYTVPPEEPPETSAFIQIDDRERNVGEPTRIFSGWMFASSPAINALEHGVYDVWVITCNTDAPPPPEPSEALSELDPFATEAPGPDAGPLPGGEAPNE